MSSRCRSTPSIPVLLSRADTGSIPVPLRKQRPAISSPAINRTQKPKENQVPPFGYLAQVMLRGESFSELPEGGTFSNSKMRTTTQNPSGHADKVLAFPNCKPRLAERPEPKGFTAEQTSGLLRVSFTLPTSIAENFRNYSRWNSKSPWREVEIDPDKYGLYYYITESLRVGTGAPGGFNWDAPFNERRCGLPSRKGRLKNIRRLEKREVSETLSFSIDFDFWQRVKDRADFYGITPAEHIQVCLSYHAALWERENTQKPPKSFASFEKGLARDAKMAKA